MTDLGIELDWHQLDDFTPPVLTDGSVHLWWFPLKLDKQQTKVAKGLLNDIQLDKYKRRKGANKQYYLAGRYYLYELLSTYTKQRLSEINVEYGSYGKPFLNDNAGSIQFNYTDTAGYGLFAFAKDIEVGVDVEVLSRTGNFKKIVEKRYSDNEAKDVVSNKGELDREKFLAYWTRKEAYGKALGTGINYKMSDVDLAGENQQSKTIKGDKWALQQIQLPDDYIACLVNSGKQPLSITAMCLSYDDEK